MVILLASAALVLLVITLLELAYWLGVGLTHAWETCTVALRSNNDNEKE